MLPNEILGYMEDVQAEIARLEGLLEKAELAGEKLELRARIKAMQAKYKELNESK